MKSMKNNTNYFWFGKQIVLDSTDKKFTQLFFDRFQGYEQGHSEHLLSGVLKVLFSRDAVESPNESSIKFGNALSFHNSSGLVIHEYLSTKTSIKFSLTDQDVVAVSISYKSGLIFSMINLILGRLLERQLFSILIQDYVEKVLLFIAHKKAAVEILHAASVEKDGRVLVFAGLNGSGKSTAAQYFVRNLHWKLYSDNYLLLKGNQAYYGPEISRLSKRSIAILSAVQTQMGKNNFGKVLFSSPEESKSKKLRGTVDDIIILTQGPVFKHTKISQDTAQKIMTTLLAIDSETIKQHPLSLFFHMHTNTLIDLPENITYHLVQFSHPRELQGIMT